MQPTLKPELLAIVDTMAAHLAQQRSRAYASGCKYRDNDGRMCAVGCLIPDALYNPEIEGGISNVFDRATRDAEAPVVAHLRSLAPSLESNALSRFLDRAQIFHDEDSGVDDTSYLGILTASSADISNDELAGLIRTELLVRLTYHPSDEWLA